MFRRENKNLGNLRGAVQTWLNSYARLNTEAKKANRNAPIDPTTLRGNVGLIKSIRKYVALKTMMNQLPSAPPPPPGPPQFNRSAVNIQIKRIEQNLQTIIRTQTAAANKLAQLTRIQGAINKFKSEVGPMPKNITNKFSQFNRAITAARNGLGTAEGPALVQQAENKLAFVNKNATKGNIFKTPKGVYMARGIPGNKNGRVMPNAYYKVFGKSGEWSWSGNNQAYNYSRDTGNIRPKAPPPLPTRPGPPPALPTKPNKNSKANTLLMMYPNNKLNSLNDQKLEQLRQNLMSLGLGVSNRQNVGNKVNAISSVLNKRAIQEENVFSRL
ncbi:hypothetical protein AR679_gp084 [Yellowstone lake phycodnavirus 1]|uniref:hypothetical protein n=1 Tax=Yellowstone lake phycodnavirus 1 TaxID=1586713 RepID=UPI0006EB78DA|nr:hypothetical protein AR679_gp084 [Yellowstone lake phycodnavirus 1]BAT22110.1 hypothetical protein [Yellowstone lake phycodnavirus 1]